MQLKNSMKIAVLGAGYWGKKVISEYVQLTKKHASLDLPMVCDLQRENLAYCTEALCIPEDKVSQDYDAILDSDSIDAVHICTPNETHYDLCKRALLADKHVLLEKPMATNAKQAWELVGLAESEGLILQVGHIFRFNNALRMMRDLVAQSYFGTLYYLKVQWTTLMPSPLGRDIIFDLGPHPIDILNYLLRKWPIKVTCKGRAYRRKMLEELAYFNLEFDEELMAHVELSWLQPGKVRRLDVMGSKRAATIDCLDQSIQVYENGDGDAYNLNVLRNNTILDEVDHFARSIMNGHNSRNGGDVGAKNTGVLEALKRSMEEDKTIEIDLRD